MKKFFILALVIVLAIAIGIWILPKDAGVYRINKAAMEPAYVDGDLLDVDKTATEFSRGDVIIFNKILSGQNSIVVKRIIGLPSETIAINNGVIFIDNQPLDLSNLLSGDDYYVRGSAQGTLNNDEYFVIGDNHNKSLDSRIATFGPVKKQEIIGKVLGKIKK